MLIKVIYIAFIFLPCFLLLLYAYGDLSSLHTQSTFTHTTETNNGITKGQDSAILPLPPQNVVILPEGILQWEPVGMDIITHYNIYIKRDMSIIMIDKAISEVENELHPYDTLYHFPIRKYLISITLLFGVSAVDVYGNESEITFNK